MNKRQHKESAFDDSDEKQTRFLPKIIKAIISSCCWLRAIRRKRVCFPRTNVYQCSLLIETLNAINDHIGVRFTEKYSRIDFETMDDKEICLVTKSKKPAFITG